jgi:hypothetical protein
MDKIGGFGTQRFTFTAATAVVTNEPSILASTVPIKFVSFYTLSNLFLNAFNLSSLVLNEGITLGFFRNVTLAAGKSANLIEVLRRTKKCFLQNLGTEIYGRSMHIFCKRCVGFDRITTKYLNMLHKTIMLQMRRDKP